MQHSTREELPPMRPKTDGDRDPGAAAGRFPCSTGTVTADGDGPMKPPAPRHVEVRLWYDQDKLVDCTYGDARPGPQDGHVLVRVLDVPSGFHDSDVAHLVSDHHSFCAVSGIVPFYVLNPAAALMELTNRVAKLEHLIGVQQNSCTD